METEDIYEMLAFNSALTKMIAWKDFIAFSHCDSSKLNMLITENKTENKWYMWTMNYAHWKMYMNWIGTTHKLKKADYIYINRSSSKFPTIKMGLTYIHVNMLLLLIP
jgi:hypothetical protein